MEHIWNYGGAKSALAILGQSTLLLCLSSKRGGGETFGGHAAVEMCSLVQGGRQDRHNTTQGQISLDPNHVGKVSFLVFYKYYR